MGLSEILAQLGDGRYFTPDEDMKELVRTGTAVNIEAITKSRVTVKGPSAQTP